MKLFAVSSRPILALLASALWLPAAWAAAPMNYERLTEQARALAAQRWQPTPSRTPDALRQLSYDQMRAIRFKPERALWRSDAGPYELMLFHLGKYQTEPVRLHELRADGEQLLPYQAADFDYGFNQQLDPAAWGDIGHAGFRVHAALNQPGYKDELAVFQGASYFRALGRGQHYGLSARGLAVDTVGGTGEEFPRFTDFWIVHPGAVAPAAPGVAAAPTAPLVVLALMDSPRVAGAYRFEISPGLSTRMTVQATLFLRDGTVRISTLGIAPLTSMFNHGENQPHREDFRPEVHDSDGLMLATGEGEWLWRPLQNPRHPLVTSFATRSPRGFGLMQRDRQFSSYEDAEARYEARPSAWVTPLGDWGAGRVELVQLPTPDETHDNIVAYWVPAQLPAPGQPLALSWQIDWQGDAQQRPPAAWVAQTRTGRGFAALQRHEQQFIVDFAGVPAPTTTPSTTTPIPEPRAVVSTDDNGRVLEQNLYRVSATGAWRLALRVQPINPNRAVELRAFLQSGNDTVSETWTHLLIPQ